MALPRALAVRSLIPKTNFLGSYHILPRKYLRLRQSNSCYSGITCNDFNYKLLRLFLDTKLLTQGDKMPCSFKKVTSTRQFVTTNTLHKKKKKKAVKDTSQPVDPEDFIDDKLLEDPYYMSLRGDSRILGFTGSSLGASEQVGVLVVQPWVKWGASKRTNTSGQLMLDEAEALVATLPGVRIVAKEIVSVRSLDGKTIFGSGTLERLVSRARAARNISCVFISVNMMKRFQLDALQEAFGMKVLDRYSVVLGIFRHHAKTKEARLQIALAELPYIRKRLSGESDRLAVMEREKHLKAALSKLAGVRAQIRRSRTRNNLPTVAVVGYTNSGKTSLIRAITRDARAEGKDQLFATLDVTAHGGQLPCGLQVAFIDTVGFIQDIPTELVASFKATLEDAVYSDVVVHVRDANHPDCELQAATVTQTLASLPLPTKTPVITVANKIDLGIKTAEEQFEGAHFVSALTGQGLGDFLHSVEGEVLRVTGRRTWRFSLPTGSEQIQWLRSATGLAHEEVDAADPQITQVLAVMTDQELAAFRRIFGKR